jgi:hypothetical protein
MLCCAGGSCGVANYSYPDSQYVLSCGAVEAHTLMSPGECFNVTLGYNANNPAQHYPVMHCINVTCNSNPKYSCNYSCKQINSVSGSFGTMNMKYGDVVGVTIYSETSDCNYSASVSSLVITNVVQVVGCFCLGTYPTPTALIAQTCTTCTAPLNPGHLPIIAV